MVKASLGSAPSTKGVGEDADNRRSQNTFTGNIAIYSADGSGFVQMRVLSIKLFIKSQIEAECFNLIHT